jgi:predicted nucleotidyltransferase
VDDRYAQLKRIFQCHGVALAYFFGSMATPAHRFLTNGQLDVSDPLADIDIGVVFENPGVLADPASRRERYSGLFNDLTDVFPEDRLDLVFLQETHSVFQAQAMTGFCVYAVSRVFKTTYEERVLARAADFRPFLERYYEERLGGIMP